MKTNKKTCVLLGLKECAACIYSASGYSLGCWVDFYKKDIIDCCNSGEVKRYLIEIIYGINNLKFYANNIDNYINCLKAAANCVDPKYSSFIDKILLLI